MLEAIPTKPLQYRVHRFANHKDAVEFLREQGFDPQGIDDMLEILASAGLLDSPEVLCDAPFKPKRRLRHQTRFSDGSFPVFYCSLERETAQAETEHWFAHFAGQPKGERTALFSCFACDFSGDTKDLRPKREECPALTDPDDYEFCNALGAEAVKTQLDALLTPSARRPEGTNLPVFARRAISNPGDLIRMMATYNPDNGRVSVQTVQEVP